ncbi:hypothetical protein K501DRAFT_275505 [Backusella circina FSU 941]|nr:hypothetical protein K501DRAFT_275505 [Backusella circina FSU 941]
MSFMNTQVQNTLWAPIRLPSGVFTHIKNRYQAKGISVKVIPELKELLEVPQDDAIGVIIVYKYSETTSSGVNPEKAQDQSVVTFSPHERCRNHLATSALLDIFHNMNVDVIRLENLPPVKHGRKYQVIRSPELEDSPDAKDSID